ncbi:MAG: hypothetical protein GXP49_14540 [Deltaproteobacteria bacterium]|nr:hypothetical protein [Deltaproteobacteria bacterium]
MAALQAGRIGWDIGSTVDVPSQDYTELIIEIFSHGEPGYVDLLEKLCYSGEEEEEEDDDDEFEKRFRKVVAIIKH